MVGVPGRSKGCSTCRQRRIGCSLERPQCSQCAKSNRVCGGYHRERIWVPNNQVKFESACGSAAAVITVRSSNDHESAGTAIESKKGPKISDETTPAASKKDTQVALRYGFFAAYPARLPKTVSHHRSFQQQILSQFLSIFVPDSNRTPIGNPNGELTWLMLIPSLPTLTAALSTSLLALSLVSLSRFDRNTSMIMESRRLYCQALHELQKALWDPKLMYKDETLAACLALSLYEVLECPEKSDRGWLMHSNGCLKLIELRGPKAHANGLGHQLFLSCRYNSVMQSLAVNRSNFMSKPEWLSLPWSGRSKTLTDRLDDLFVTGIVVIEAAVQLGDMKTTKSLLPALEIVNRCWKIDAELRQLYEELEAGTQSPLFWLESSTQDTLSDDKELGKVFPMIYHFPSLRIAHNCILYWTLCIILWGGMWHLYRSIATMEPEPATETDDVITDRPEVCNCTSLIHVCNLNIRKFDISALPPLKNQNVISAICNVCQSFEYCIRPEMRGMGAASMAFPLQVAASSLREIPGMHRELAWIQAALIEIQERGFRILRYTKKDGT